MKILLDTNVLIDYYLHRQGFYENASKIIMGAMCKDFDVWASAKSYTDIFYVGKKLAGVGEKPQAGVTETSGGTGACERSDDTGLSGAQVSAQLQRMFFESFKYINVVSLDLTDLRTACLYGWEDYEDCLVSVAAEKINASYIVTRDIAGFKSSKVKPITPEQFLEIVKVECGVIYEEVKF